MMASTLALSLALLVPLQTETPLERAQRLLADADERSSKEGTGVCVEENSPAAVELLLEALALEADRGNPYLPSAHYRDVVWGGLLRMTSAGARERVAKELENKRNAWVRQWCAEVLGAYGEARFAGPLTEALGDKELGVRRAAARALGKLGFPEESGTEKSPRGAALAELADLAKDKDPILRANAIEASLRLAPERFESGFGQALLDKDAGVRCALLGAAGEIDPSRSEPFAVAALEDLDWRPRLQAVDVLATIHTPTALQHLIGALEDARPVVVARALRHLREISGEKHTKREAWEAWWREKGAGFAFPGKKAAATPDATSAAAFIGIVFESDHTAFLIDTSLGMTKDLKSKSLQKAAAARQELELTLTRLQGKLRFSLYTYANEVAPFAKKMPVDLTAKTQEKALEFVRDARLDGAKDVWLALETVLADPSIDTVFLLSTGEPEVGLYVHWNRVAYHLAELNRFRKVVLHAIDYSDDPGFREHLEKLAHVTGGEYRFCD